MLVPVSMKEDADYNAEMDETSWVKLRHRHDLNTGRQHVYTYAIR